MGVITVRLPEDTHQRVKTLASSRNISINKLYEEFTIMALTQFDAENRFKALASRGNKQRGLELLKNCKTITGMLAEFACVLLESTPLCKRGDRGDFLRLVRQNRR